MTTAKWISIQEERRRIYTNIELKIERDCGYLAARFNEKECLQVWEWRCP
jgi:hypothetical protein